MEFIEIYKSKISLIKHWIYKNLENHRSERVNINSLNFQLLDNYYSKPLLENTFVIYCDRIPVLPLSDIGLTEFSEMNTKEFRGMTYLDCFFIRNDQRQNELLHFHELVHIIQWNYLGIDKFLFCYALGLLKYGYRNSPLEDMAYNLESKFIQKERFNIEQYIINEMRYFDELLVTSNFQLTLKS